MYRKILKTREPVFKYIDMVYQFQSEEAQLDATKSNYEARNSMVAEALN